MSTDAERLWNLVSHIEHVQRNCKVMAVGLIDRGDFGTAKALMVNAQVHDQSKFRDEEWEYLNDEVWPHPGGDAFRDALHWHTLSNLHHPEAHEGGIHAMPRVYVLEMLADWASRSGEQGTDLYDVIVTRLMPRFKFSFDDPVWETISEGLGLLGVS